MPSLRAKKASKALAIVRSGVGLILLLDCLGDVNYLC